MLRKISLSLNLIVVIISSSLFVYTFIAQTHLKERTRTFITEKTISYSGPLLEITKAGLKSPISKQLISQEQRDLIEGEVLVYESDPVEYVTSLTSSNITFPAKGKTAKIKGKIRDHYQTTLSTLITDLRIFSGSNIIAGLFALWLLLFSEGLKKRDKVIAFSFIVFAAVAFSTYSYIEGISFFKILFNWHVGWWYPVSIVITMIGLALDHGLHTKSSAEKEEKELLQES